MDDDDQASPDRPVLIDDLTPEEASRIIHSHRKVRYGSACWPCRQRKVKCDNKQPCENCVKREHTQLCSYKPNQRNQTKSVPPKSGTKRPLSPSSADSGHRSEKRQDSWPRAFASSDDADVPQIPRYMGLNSIPSLLRDQSAQINSDDDGEIRVNLQSILGLDTSAPFPLMSSKHLDRLTQDITAELPSDREVMKLFKTYKETPQQFWGFVIDIDDLESRLMIYLEERARNSRSTTKPTKVSATWLAILFAVLAVGSQYHDSPYEVRTRNSQKYIQIAFHFLRLGNFLLRPTFDSVQALLLTSFVLLNDMKAEASWALLGLTCRLSQSIGLHRPSPHEGRESAPPDAKSKEMIRRKLWWTCTWHDTLTSLSFDRSPMTNVPACCALPIATQSPTGDFSYLEAMYNLTHIISRRVTPDVMADAAYDTIVDICADVEGLRDRVSPQIRHKDRCKTVMDRLQHFAVRLHTAFIVSVACRPAIRRDCPQLGPEQKRFLAQKCQQNLAETVRMFLAMHQLSVIPTRSWAFTYNGLSSALLLGILTETKSDPEVRQLQGDLIAALSAAAAKEQGSPLGGLGGGLDHQPLPKKSDKDIELSGPLSRALDALRNIYEHGSIIGHNAPVSVKTEPGSVGSGSGGSGNRTPLPPISITAPATAGAGANNSVVYRPSAQASVDPHQQEAAIAMAEMQNGTPLSDYASLTPGGSQMHNVTMSSMGQVDPGTAYNMSPMDVYEQIWWDQPEMWNTGLDSMTFDFVAQPPPGQQQQQSGLYF